MVSGIVVAAGRSTRFGGDVPKPFAEIDGGTVLERSVACLVSEPRVDDGVVVVLPEPYLDGDVARRVRRRAGVRAIVPGGATRTDSVRAGVEACGSSEFVLVHDGARPLASAALVRRVLDATLAHGAAVPALPVSDTVRRRPAGVTPEAPLACEALVDRAGLEAAQTPQGSRTEWLLEALAGAGTPFGDDAAALAAAGHDVATVPGERRNLKITTREDLDLARRLAGPSAGEIRIGNGFDVHRFDPARELRLGGVAFEGEPGLSGHSDADVVLHAAMDAVLGAAGLGDIGRWFPAGDPAFADADSRRLAAEVSERVAAAGWEIGNLDLTVLGESPKIAPRREELERSIADAFGVAEERVSVKATTLEGLGSLGRREGLACQAVALVRRITDAR